MSVHQRYAVEMVAIFVSGLGMMLLVTISVWMATLLASGSATLADEVFSDSLLESRSDSFAYIESLVQDNSGQVAGVVDDSSIEENQLRNSATAWLSGVREVQSLPTAYRDSVLDRNAQNHARYLATSCSDDRYSDWDESLGSRINEGYVATFSESTFSSDGTSFAHDFVYSQQDYARLFGLFSAVGVGVAEYADSPSCDSGYVFVYHLADIR